MNYHDIIKEIKTKKYRKIYFLAGEETYYIDLISNYIENYILNESEKDFNQTVIYGREADINSIISLAKQFPIMAKNTVIIIKEAQNIKNIEDFNKYINQPLNTTILVVCYRGKNLDKRKTLYKNIINNGLYFESKKLNENKIPKWISSYLAKKNRKIEKKTAMILTEFLGNDLLKISKELDKLCIIIPENFEITLLDIEQNIGISKEYNNFEFQNAIMNKDSYKAIKIINYFKSNPKKNPLILSLLVLYNLFSKLIIYHTISHKNPKIIAQKLSINSYFISDYQKSSRLYNLKNSVNALSIIREADVKSKGYKNLSTSDHDLLKEVVNKLCH